MSHPKIASWLAKKDQIIASQKPYDLVMSGWFTPEEATALRAVNPNMKLLAGLSINWVMDDPNWMEFLRTVGNHGSADQVRNFDDMYLRDANGNRVPFGWASTEWNQPEIWAMDPRNPRWVSFITSFYRTVFAQTQHDGIIVDMVTQRSWSPATISDFEWVSATQAIMRALKAMRPQGKTIIFNSGRNLSEIRYYRDFMDGYLMENFMGAIHGSTFWEGYGALLNPYARFTTIFASDTDNTGIVDQRKMRLGLTLSMLGDNKYFTYDFGPRDHGQAWWFPEYDVDIGRPLAPTRGLHTWSNMAFVRQFLRGKVVCAPIADTLITFRSSHRDITTGFVGTSFTVPAGDGRIFLQT